MAKTLTKYKVIIVFCKCWCKLVKYKKWPGRRLLKIHRDRIIEDYTWWLLKDNFSPIWTNFYCPCCKNRFATMQLINWKYVFKVNQWQLWEIKRN